MRPVLFSIALLIAAVSTAGADEGGASVMAPPGLANGSWSEPVELARPPAARDVAPELALVVAQGTVDSEVGSGWRLQATSVIRRRSPSNGVPSTTTGTSLYLVDGVELVPVTGPGVAHYQPEAYDGSRFDYNTTTKVWTRQRDGWTWTYGGVTNSTRTIVTAGLLPLCATTSDCNIESWYLSSVVDPFGNRMDYAYLAPALPATLTGKYPGITKSGERLVDSITYAAGTAKVKFIYAARPDLRVEQSGGALVFTTQRLIDVTTTTGATTYSRYRFVYEDQASDSVVGTVTGCDGQPVTATTPAQSLLRAIYQVGAAGTPKRMIRCNTYFHGPTTWASGARVDSVVVNPFPNGIDPLTDSWTPTSVDLDGDARTDLALLALRDGTAAYHRVYIATPNRTDAFVDANGASAASVLAAQWQTRLNAKLTATHYSNKYGHTITDLTGDGLPELLYEDGQGLGTTIEHPVSGAWLALTNSLNPCDLRFGQLADVDGDHRPDVVVRAHAANAGCIARSETRWVKNLGAAPWFDSAQAQTLNVPLEAGTVPAAWTTALGSCGGVATPPTDYNPDWDSAGFVADQARFEDFNDDGVLDVAYALYGCWTTINDPVVGSRWTPITASLYSRIFFGNGRGAFVDSGLGAGAPVLLDPLALGVAGNTRITPGTLAMADLDRDGHGELLQSTASANGYGIGGYGCKSVATGFVAPTTPGTATYALWSWQGTAWDCHRRTLQPAWGDYDGDGFLDKLSVQWNEVAADGACPINTWCVTLAKSGRDISEGRMVATDNEHGGRTRLTWGFSALSPNANPSLPVNLEVIASVDGPGGTHNFTYRDGVRAGDRATGFSEVSSINDRGATEVYSFIIAAWAMGQQYLGVRYREDGSTEHVTNLIHGQRWTLGFFVSTSRPYFNPLIRRCEYDVGFVNINLETLDDQCNSLAWQAPAAPQSGILTSDLIRYTPDNQRLLLGHDRHLEGDADNATYAQVWGKSTTGSSSYRAAPAPSRLEPLSLDAEFLAIRDDLVMVGSPSFFYWPVPGTLSGKIPDIEQQEASYTYPSFLGSPDGYAWDYGYDNGVRKLVNQYQHRDLSTTLDDRRIDYTWNQPLTNGYWYEMASATLVDRNGARLNQLSRSSFAKFDTPRTVSNCGVTSPTDCRTDSYVYATNGTVTRHTLPDATVETWTRLAWCGEPLTHVDPAGRTTTFTRTAGCLVQTAQVQGATTTNTYDPLQRLIKREVDPGGGAGAGARLSHTLYYDDALSWNATVGAREDAGYVEPRSALRRSDGQLTLQYRDGLGRLTRVRECQDALASTTGGDIGLVACSAGTDRTVMWNLYGTDGMLKVTTDPFAGAELPTTHGVGHDGLGRPIASIDPTHSSGGPSWNVTTVLYGAGYESRTEPMATGSRVVRYSHSTTATSLTIDGIARGSNVLDPLGMTSSSTAPDGKLTQYSYDGRHHLARAKLVSSLGSDLLETNLDANGAIIVTNHEHQITRRDLRDRVLEEVMPDGRVIAHSYDAADRELTRTVDGVLERTRAYVTPTPTVQGAVSITDNLGGATATTTVDGLGRPWRRTGPRQDDLYVYDTTGRLVARTDALAGLTTNYGYDRFDRLTAVTDPAAGTTTASYGGADRALTSTDADGVVTEFTYSYAGDLLEDRRGGFLLRAHGYDVAGQLVTATQDGIEYALEYDNLGRMTRRREGVDGATHLRAASYGYDAGDRVIEVRRSPVMVNLESITTISYDNWGRPYQEIDGAGGVTHLWYDRAGHTARVVDPAGGQLDTRYDAWGRVVARQRPGHGWEHFAYLGNQVLNGEPGLWRIEQWDDEDAARGVKTVAYVDGGGHQLEEVRRDGSRLVAAWVGRRLMSEELLRADGTLHSTMSRSYDDGGRLAGTVRGPYATSYGYSAAGRLLTVTTPDDTIERTYQGGFMASERQAGVTTRLIRGGTSPWVVGVERQVDSGPVRFTEIGRDQLGRITHLEISDGVHPNLDRNFIGYDYYDNAWLETSSNGLANVVESKSFDQLGQQLSRTTSGTGLPGLTTTWSWLANGAPASVTTPSGRVLAYDYGASFDYQLDQIQLDGSVVARIDARDARGAITSLRLPTASQTRTFRYDAMGRIDRRLSGAAMPGPGLSWTATYEADGRLASEAFDDSVNGAAWNNAYRYDGAGRLIHEDHGRSGEHYDYLLDAAGNRLSTADGSGATVMSATYSGPRLTAVDGQALTYDPWNAVTLDHHGNNYLRSADGEVTALGGNGAGLSLLARTARGLAVAATDGTQVRRTTWSLDPAGLPLEVDEGDGDVLTYLDVEGHHVATFTNGAIATVDSDGRNSMMRWGTQTLGYADAAGLGLSAPAGTDDRFLYAMLESAPTVSEVLLARHRTYDPATGRFLEPDPIGAAGGVEGYQYGGGDPVNFVDPLGHAAIGSDCTPAGGPNLHVDPIEPRSYDFETSWAPPSVMDQIAASGLGQAAYLQNLADASSWLLDLDAQPQIPGTGPLCVVNCGMADGQQYEDVTEYEEEDFDPAIVIGDPVPTAPGAGSGGAGVPAGGGGSDDDGTDDGGGGQGKGGGWLSAVGDWLSDHFTGGPAGRGQELLADAFADLQAARQNAVDVMNIMSGPDHRLLNTLEDAKNTAHLAIDVPSIVRGQPQHDGTPHGPSVHDWAHSAVEQVTAEVIRSTASTTCHFGLDCAGLVFPQADAANAVVYTLEGDPANAAISAYSVIPWGDYAKAARAPVYVGKFAELAPMLFSSSDAEAASFRWGHSSWFIDLVSNSRKGRLQPKLRGALADAEVEVYNRTGRARPKDACPHCDLGPDYRWHGEPGGLTAARALEEAIPGTHTAAVVASRDFCDSCSLMLEQAGFFFITPRIAVRKGTWELGELQSTVRALGQRNLDLHGGLTPREQTGTTTAITRMMGSE